MRRIDLDRFPSEKEAVQIPLAGDKALWMVPGGIMPTKDACHDAR